MEPVKAASSVGAQVSRDPLAGRHAARIPLIDQARGVALIAMTVFHFCWDLAMFRLVEPSLMGSFGMVWFARSIAGTFLFLVGFSLVLGHGSRLRARAFAIRLAKVSAAAAVISLATWYATPQAWIFFGILHQIAFASIAGLLFMYLPWAATAIAAAIFLLARVVIETPPLEGAAWYWTGLTTTMPVSKDYVPVFPFFGMVLLGIAAGRLMTETGSLVRLEGVSLPMPIAGLTGFIGRHSLVYYLLHQPVMIAILYCLLWLGGNI